MKDDVEDLLLKGSILDEQTKYEEAIQFYDAVLQLNPEHEKALLNKGLALISIQKNNEALQIFEKLISVNPNNFFAWVSKGVVFNQLKKYNEAIESLDKALLFDPNSGYAFYNRGIALFALGKPEDALDDYDRALTYNPSHFIAINLKKSLVLEALGQFEAAEEIRKSIKAKGMKHDNHDIVDEMDAHTFANILKNTQLVNNQINFGKFVLRCSNGFEDIIQYNHKDWQLLGKTHQYIIPLLAGDLKLAIQLYYNVSNFWRLFCFSKINGVSGMLFSVNLSTEKDAKGAIFLTQKLKFSGRFTGNEKLAAAHRRMKQSIFAELLRKLHYDVTDNNDVILGIFDTNQGKFVNTTPEKFLEDFIAISILKGHFMGNKGYELEIMPSYNRIQKLSESYDANIDPIKIPEKFVEQKGKRTISLSIRYKVLIRDGRKCVMCGRSPEDGIKLHVDHITPYSLGGLTAFENLQTLCEECNLGKGNRFSC